jgi:hypothetical protein
MAKRLSLLVVGMMFGLVLWGGLVSASGQAPQQQLLRFTDETTKSGYVDNDPEDISVGDVFTSHGVLHQGSDQAGAIALVGTVTLRSSAETGEALLAAVAKLHDGHIALSGRLFFLPKNQTFKMAITGGTGAYRNARGHAVFEQVSGDTTKLTFYVIP